MVFSIVVVASIRDDERTLWNEPSVAEMKDWMNHRAAVDLGYLE
jgi:hypothetical protein